MWAVGPLHCERKCANACRLGWGAFPSVSRRERAGKVEPVSGSSAIVSEPVALGAALAPPAWHWHWRRLFERTNGIHTEPVPTVQDQSVSPNLRRSMVRRFAMLAVSLSLLLGLSGGPPVRPGRREEGRADETKATTSRQDRRPRSRRGQEGRAAAADPARGRGEARGRPPRRGRGDRRRPGRRAGQDLDRPAADPRHPDHRPRQRREHPQGQDRRQPRGLRRLVHRLRQDRRASSPRTTSGSPSPPTA